MRFMIVLAAILLSAAACTAPDFTLSRIDGTTVSLSELRTRPVLVDFGATWCPSCRLDYPHLSRVYEQRADMGVEMLVVSIAEDRAIVERFIRSSGVSFNFVLDEGTVAQQYRVVSLPTKYFIDGSGVVRQV